jgi:hypothetical protein
MESDRWADAEPSPWGGFFGTVTYGLCPTSHHRSQLRLLHRRADGWHSYPSKADVVLRSRARLKRAPHRSRKEYQIMLLTLLAYFGGVLTILSSCILPILRRLTRLL